jgi:hypothetical protein
VRADLIFLNRHCMEQGQSHAGAPIKRLWVWPILQSNLCVQIDFALGIQQQRKLLSEYKDPVRVHYFVHVFIWFHVLTYVCHTLLNRIFFFFVYCRWGVAHFGVWCSLFGVLHSSWGRGVAHRPGCCVAHFGAFRSWWADPGSMPVASTHIASVLYTTFQM